MTTRRPGARFLYETTIAAEREHNVHIHSGISEEQFVAMRTARDATLGMPTLILPSVQINMRGGELPEPESNGTRYLKIPWTCCNPECGGRRHANNKTTDPFSPSRPSCNRPTWHCWPAMASAASSTTVRTMRARASRRARRCAPLPRRPA